MTQEKALELTLCGMLPYDLNILYSAKNKDDWKFEKLVGIINYKKQNEIFHTLETGNHSNKSWNLKPLLHSMEKLTQPILDGGLIPIEELLRVGIEKGYIEHKHKNFPIEYKIVQKPFGKMLKCTNLDSWVLLITFSDCHERNKGWVSEWLKENHFNLYGLDKSQYLEKSEVNTTK